LSIFLERGRPSETVETVVSAALFQNPATYREVLSFLVRSDRITNDALSLVEDRLKEVERELQQFSTN
jgi:hypothetical protein